MASFGKRLVGAATLNVAIYEEVEADTSATGQALVVVVLSSLAAGVGTYSIWGLTGVLGYALGDLISWFIWAGLTFLIGTRLLPEPQTESNLGELLRTIGFSSSPGLLRVLGFLPGFGGMVGLITGFWMLVAMIVAVRQALDYRSTGRAVGVCLIGFITYQVLKAAIRWLLGLDLTTLGI